MRIPRQRSKTLAPRVFTGSCPIRERMMEAVIRALGVS